MAVNATAAMPAAAGRDTTPCGAGADQPALKDAADMPRSQVVGVRTDADGGSECRIHDMRETVIELDPPKPLERAPGTRPKHRAGQPAEAPVRTR